MTTTHTLRDLVRNDNIRERLKESKTEAVWRLKEARPRLRRKKDSGDGNTREKRKRKTEAAMDGLCQPRHESYQDNRRWMPWQNWLEENCVCRSDPTIKWERLEEEEDDSDPPVAGRLKCSSSSVSYSFSWRLQLSIFLSSPSSCSKSSVWSIVPRSRLEMFASGRSGKLDDVRSWSSFWTRMIHERSPVGLRTWISAHIVHQQLQTLGEKMDLSDGFARKPVTHKDIRISTNYA